jgi:hypothetical protein
MQAAGNHDTIACWSTTGGVATEAALSVTWG